MQNTDIYHKHTKDKQSFSGLDNIVPRLAEDGYWIALFGEMWMGGGNNISSSSLFLQLRWGLFFLHTIRTYAFAP